jgi:hypothetical protein
MMMFLLKAVSLAFLLSKIATVTVVFAQQTEEDGAGDDYQTFDYQFQISANVAECPSADVLPFVLNDPVISASKKAVILTYEVIVPDPEWVSYEVFDASTCTIPIPTGNSGSEPLIPTLDVRHVALTGAATATLTLEVNEAGLQDYGSMIYTETERSGAAPAIESKGDVTFCVRMNIYNGLPSEATDSGDIQKVTWVDAQTVFVARLVFEDESMLAFTSAGKRERSRLLVRQGLQEVDAAGNPRVPQADPTPRRSSQRRHLCDVSTWGMEIITCPDTIDENTTSPFSLVDLPNNSPIPKSEPVRLCIQPNAATRDAGVTMKKVESLYYRAMPFVQPGVEAGFISGDGMTMTACGATMCILESSLYDDFFGPRDNEIMISGVVLFQPSAATGYNQIHVEFEMPIKVRAYTAADRDASGSGGFSLRSIIYMAVMVAGGVLTFLLL